MATLPLTLLGVMLVFGPSIANPTERATEPNPTPEIYRLNKNYKPLTYTIDIEVLDKFHEAKNESNKRPFNGKTTIAIEKQTTAMSNVLQLHMDTFIANEDSLTIKMGSVVVPKEKYKYNNVTEILEISNFTEKNEFDLTFEYVGHIYDDMHGFYLSDYKDENNATKYVATTQFQPTYARRAFPCWDEPEYKAEFTISIAVPANYHALGNQLSDIAQGNIITDKRQTFKFNKTPKMSTYLVAFVVSDFDSKDVTGTTNSMKVWAPKKLLDNAAYAADISWEILETQGKLLDKDNTIPFFPKMGVNHLDTVAIPDFSAGAMENWGLMTFRETALLVDSKSPKMKEKERVATVIAHEFAHSWFGDWVTTHWWSDTWLNEGFARYFEAHCIAHIPRLQHFEMQNQFVLNDVHKVLETDGNAGALPLSSDAETPSEISAKFGTITYSKGGSIVRMMEKLVGKDIFMTKLTEYLLESREKNSMSTPSDLFMKLGNIGDMTLMDIMDEWIKQPGYPVVEAELVDDKVIVSQKQFLYKEDSEKSELMWNVPITFTTISSNTATSPTTLPTTSPTIPPALRNAAFTDPRTENPTETPTETTTDPSTELPTETPTETPTAPTIEPPTKPPTEPSIAPPTEPPTKPPTEPPTNPPTVPTIAPPTEPPTKPPTEPPTNPPTEPPTAPPTEPPTKPPTEPPTKPPTEPPTAPPTEPPTKPPTEPPTNPPTVPTTAPPTEPPTKPPTEPPTAPPTEPPTAPNFIILTKKEPKKNLTTLNDEEVIIINPENVGFFRVKYDAKLWGRIVTKLTNAHEEIDPVTRAQLINDAMNLARASQLAYDDAFGLLDYMAKETDYYPWRSAYTAFSYLRKRLVGDSLRTDITSKMLTLSAKFFEANKDFKTPNDTAENAIEIYAKVLALEWACELGETDCVQEAKKQFHTISSNETRIEAKDQIDVNFNSIVYCAGLRHANNAEEGRTDWHMMFEKFNDANNAAEKVTILTALGCTTDKELLKQYLEMSLNNTLIRSQDASTVFTAVLAGNPEGVDVAQAFLQDGDNFHKIRESYGSLSALSNVFLQLADRLTTSAQVKSFTEFVEKNKADLGDAVGVAQNAIAAAEANIEWADKTKKDLQKLFNNGAADLAATSFIGVILVSLVARLF